MLSIIIINFNTKQLCINCINSIRKTCVQPYEVIVVDNGTKPEEKYVSDGEDVRVFECENKGFGYACNIGADKASGEYILMLNSDTIVHENALDLCLDYLKSHPDTGAVGAKLVLPDGSMDHGCRRGFPTPLASFYYMAGFDRRHPENKKYGAYRLTYLSDNETSEVDVVSGAFMMMQKKVFDEIGGFDEDYFMYGEDIDLCYRIKETGKKVVFLPSATTLHIKGQSGLHTKNRKILYHFYRSMSVFYKKNLSKKYSIFTGFFIYAAIYFKFALSWMLSFFKRG